jgi:hypothetical protein
MVTKNIIYAAIAAISCIVSFAGFIGLWQQSWKYFGLGAFGALICTSVFCFLYFLDKIVDERSK